jgi:hypothetical protein
MELATVGVLPATSIDGRARASRRHRPSLAEPGAPAWQHDGVRAVAKSFTMLGIR